ncbi:alkaline phosphatase [Desulfitobacterium sp. AusDCA]|uniref:alkaline phosphatase n=1 Tax=Desulfitobacterium sp. AusDCA TaxID=3240383 RepID=UPI003DA777D3
MNKRTIKNSLSLSLIVALAFGVAVPQQASAASSAPTAKNVIMMIPDGMSVGATTLARYMLNEKGDVPLNLDEYVTAMVKTRWTNGPITDSAPAATAYATGNKTISGALGVDASLNPHASVLEAAQLEGKATGLIATSEFMHATPAGYSSHEVKRSNYAPIAEQMLNQKLDVLLGTGAAKVDTKVLDIIGIAKDKGYTVLNDRNELLATNADHVWGNFTGTISGKNNLSYDLDRDPAVEPSLAEMTTKAIELLNRDKDGFFLMVEGSKIDWAAHANDTVGIATDTLAFDKAFKAAVDFAKADGNTIVIAATDHGNSGITIGSNASTTYDKDGFGILAPLKGAAKTAEGAMVLVDKTKSEASLDSALKAYGIDPADAAIAKEIAAFKADPTTANLVKTMSTKCAIGYTTGGHTGEDVPLYVFAPAGVKLPKGVIDNTSVATFVADSMGVNLSEATSKLFVDVTSMGTMDTQTNEFTFNRKDGKLVKIKANQSVASVDGVPMDLDGQVAVYTDKHFYVPKQLVDNNDEQKVEQTQPKVEQTQPEEKKVVNYTVQPGDTLSEIAQKFGTTYQTIQELNNIVDPDLIYPGQIFVMP